MANDSIDRVTVLGAGVLGGQIAWHSAFKGKRVVLYDPFPDALQRATVAQQMYERIYRGQLGARDADIEATRARLTATGDLAAAVADADLVIEAAPEVPEVKAEVYRAIAPLLPPRAIVATNSSTLLPRDFADLTGRPAQFCALHFANLIWALNVAEVMAHAGTSPATLTAVTRFAIEIGQVPIAVQKKRSGYVLNAWLKPLLTASLSVVVDGVATAEDVDRTFMIVNRGCTMGPFGTIDVIGMKTVYDVSAYWATVTGDARMQRNADYIKENFLDRGLQGMLGGQGFYTYPDPAYAAPDFLAVPGLAAVPELVARMLRK